MRYLNIQLGKKNFLIALYVLTLSVAFGQKDRPSNVPRISVPDERWEKGGVFAGYKPEDELLQFRTEISKTFKNPNGTNSACFVGAVHYKDENGFWQDIDKSIVHSNKDDYAYMNVTNKFETYFPKNSHGAIELNNLGLSLWFDKRVIIKNNGNEILSLAYDSKEPWVGSEFNLLYNDVLDQISEEFKIEQNGFKYNTLLKQMPSFISNELNADEFVLSQNLRFPIGTKFFNKGVSINQNFVADDFAILLPGQDQTLNFGAINVLGTNISNNTIEEELNKDVRSSSLKGLPGKYIITFLDSNVLNISISIPISYLKGEILNYPIVIDPQITMGATVIDFDGLWDGWRSDTKTQSIYLSSELTAAGIVNGSTFSAIDLYWTDVYCAADLQGCTIRLRTTASTSYTSASFNNTSYTTYYSATKTPSSNTWASNTLSSTYTFSSASNLDIEIVMDQGARDCSSSFLGIPLDNNYMNYFNAGSNRSLYSLWTTNVNPLTSTGTGNLDSYIPQIRITFTGPVITASTSSLTAFSSCSNTASSSQSFTVSGTNMAAGITVTAPTGFEVSTNNSTWSGNGGNVTVGAAGTIASTTIYVRMAALASAPSNGNVACTSSGATTVNVSVSGTLITSPVVTTTTVSSVANFTATSGGNVTITSGSVTQKGVIWGISPGLTLTGTYTSDGSGTGTYTSSITGLSSSTVYYYVAYATSSSGCTSYGTEMSFTTTGPSPEGYYISGNVTNNGSIISTNDANYMRMTGTGMSISGTGTFTNTKLFADGTTTYSLTPSGASNFSETFVNASKSLTVADAKTYTNGTMSNYGTLTLNGTGIINNSLNWVNGGTLTVAATGEITVGGSWTNNGTFTPASGLVTFDGSNNSIIGGSSAISFYKLKMNKSASTVTTTLAANATITNTLTLTLGHLVTGSYIAYVSNNASGAVSGGSSNSYVKGKLKRAVAGAYTYVFPVGQSLYEEAQLNFTAGYTSADITAFFTDGSPGNLPSGGLTVSGTPLTSILDKGYWSIDPSAGASGSPTYSVTLKETGHNNDATSASQYTVIKRSNSPSVGAWSIQGTHSNTTQSDVGNVVTAVRSELATFSDFAIAYGGGALPIELISFQANCSDQNTVDVTWSTASEHNTNYFRVDKSRDGMQWDVLNTIGAAGNSNYTIDYALTDAFPNPGINYYRLTQYDLDGVFETFDAQAAVCKDQQSGTALSSYPNPSSGDFNVDLQTDELEGEATLLITDAKGAVVHSQDIKIIKGNNNFVIHPSTGSGQGFEPGIYYISVRTATSTITTKHSMR